jgi:hypothetical protein
VFQPLALLLHALGTRRRGGSFGVQSAKLRSEVPYLGGEFGALVVVYHLGDLSIECGDLFIAGRVMGVHVLHLTCDGGRVTHRLGNGCPYRVIYLVRGDQCVGGLGSVPTWCQ